MLKDQRDVGTDSAAQNTLRVLWVDPATLLVAAVIRSLRQVAPSWHVMNVPSPEKGLIKVQDGGVDLVLLERAFPDRPNAGLDLCRKLREKHREVGIVVLSCWEGTDDRVEALEAGADDFIGKTDLRVWDLRQRLLVAFQLAQRRGVAQNNEQTLKDSRRLNIGPISIDTRTQAVLLDGRPVSPHQQRLLWCLLAANGNVVAREELCLASGIQRDEQYRNLNTELWRLRRLLGDRATLLEVVRGRGVRVRSEYLKAKT